MAHFKKQIQEEFSNNFGPLYNKRRSKFISYLKQNPKKSFCWMILLLSLNFILMLFLDTHATKSKNPLTNMGDYLTHRPLAPSNEGKIEPSFSNIITLREIQDSIKFFSAKEHLITHTDTVLLTALLRRYATIDPSIFKGKIPEIK